MTPTRTPTFTPSATLPVNGVVMAIIPDTQSVGVGTEFNVNIEVRASAQQVDGAAGYLNFDPALLEVVSISAVTSQLSVTVEQSFDNALGTANYAAGRFSAPFPSGTFTIATLRFRAKAQSAGTPITFNTTNPRKTDVTFGGNLVLAGVANGNVIITSGVTLNISPTMQNRNAANLSFQVKIVPQGGGVALYNGVATADANGVISLPALPPGAITVWIKFAQSISVMTNVTLATATNPMALNIMLLLGDTNNDNIINIQDFSILATSFGKSVGQVGFDARADFNGDGIVNIQDFSILATNFGKFGPAMP